MTYSLIKQDGSNIGDSGLMSTFIYEKEGKIVYEPNSRPRVGGVIRVGSHYARSYSSQDWWQTSLISEILEETEDRVLFKTASGSVYEWKETI